MDFLDKIAEIAIKLAKTSDKLVPLFLSLALLVALILIGLGGQ